MEQVWSKIKITHVHIKSIKIKYQSHLLLNLLIWLKNTIGFNNFHQIQDFRYDYLLQWSIRGIATNTETINYVCQIKNS